MTALTGITAEPSPDNRNEANIRSEATGSNIHGIENSSFPTPTINQVIKYFSSLQ